MEGFALFKVAAFLISISMIGLPSKVKKLEQQVKKQSEK